MYIDELKNYDIFYPEFNYNALDFNIKLRKR